MRYIIAFLVAIGLIVLVFVLFLSGGSGNKPQKPVTNLLSYANTNTVVQLTIDGPILAEQTHRQVQITIGQSQATMNVIQGYENTILNHVSYTNNTNAYTVFLHAINLAGFTKTKSTTQPDDRGVCPQGDRYIFEIINGATDIQRLWATSCGGQGTYGGMVSVNISLFQRQIPDYGKLTNGVSISPQ